MTAPEVKGWCPGAFRPMTSGDGLVVRVRPHLGAVDAVQLRGLADLAEQHGSGVIEATARANLQLRGVSEAAYPALMQGLHAIGLLGAADSEARRNLVLDPFRQDEFAEDIAKGLASALETDEFANLPGKFGFVIDPGPQRHLAGVSGDVRIEATRHGMLVRADGCATGIGVLTPEEAIGRALDLTRWFLSSGGVGPDGRGRMARHLKSGAVLPDALNGNAIPADPVAPARPGPRERGLNVAAAFGQFSAPALRALAPCGNAIRVTPFRMLFLPGALILPEHPDLILDPLDPLRRMQACTGAPGCPQASVVTRDLARRLAARVPEGQVWHVSGCAKGCAYPRPADVTMTGRDGAFDLVKRGTPWDAPIRCGLTPADLNDKFRP
ncbi:precorrin-3B synthase [Antarctobacter jejuensis]|uniref:precorrin-3B synthase n=1 Tax=Antarctobacter jejuensis TaxID=1439938 RepID=UPI003FCFAF28